MLSAVELFQRLAKSAIADQGVTLGNQALGSKRTSTNSFC